MIQSMTGFGRAITELPEKKITIEIRSLNSKSLDLNLRVPSIYKDNESDIRKVISEKLQRGKIDVTIYIENKSTNKTQNINVDVIKSYFADFKKITPEASEAELLAIVMRLPDVLSYPTNEIDEEEWSVVMTCLSTAIDKIITFRTDEGKVTAIEFENRINKITHLLNQITPFEEERITTIKNRFQKKLEELNTEVDQNRFEQEIIYYLEKLDVSEEKSRLQNHCNYFLENMFSNESNGKKLGFIAQEIGREVNTLGSKSNHSEMQKIVVQMKDELEKIKEQILNIL